MDTQQQKQLEEQASVVFATAVTRYVETLAEAEATSFMEWLTEHTNDDDLLAHMLQSYPKFGDMFADEIEKFGATKSNF